MGLLEMLTIWHKGIGVVIFGEKMEPNADEYLSAEELRDRLYHSLRGRGMVNSIKVSPFKTVKHLLYYFFLLLDGFQTICNKEQDSSQP